ncbi:MAG TPA: hypothetical protein DCP91_03815 [Eggerthellaceae bacterium]|nr:hypothetical protein [Eggerthellaceae bacterium]
MRANGAGPSPVFADVRPNRAESESREFCAVARRVLVGIVAAWATVALCACSATAPQGASAESAASTSPAAEELAPQPLNIQIAGKAHASYLAGNTAEAEAAIAAAAERQAAEAAAAERQAAEAAAAEAAAPATDAASVNEADPTATTSSAAEDDPAATDPAVSASPSAAADSSEVTSPAQADPTAATGSAGEATPAEADPAASASPSAPAADPAEATPAETDSAAATDPTEAAAPAGEATPAQPLPPTVVESYEPDTAALVPVVVRATLANEGEKRETFHYRARFYLVDSMGRVLSTVQTEGDQFMRRAAHRDITATVVVPRAQFNVLAGINVGLLCYSEGRVCASWDAGGRTPAAAKLAYLESEVQRAKAERIQAWRARFRTDDYSNTVLIGDSIMQNATAALESAMPGVTVNADAGRTLENGGLVFEGKSANAGVLDHVRKDDGSYERYVIGTGNNDVGGVSEEAAEEIVECLGPDKEIYFVTEMVVGNSRGTATTNATIDTMVQRYPNVHKIDWHGLVAGRESQYLSDGCHPRANRLPDYAALIKESLDEIPEPYLE